MTATRQFVTARVGDGGVKRGSQVAALQQLLLAAGMDVPGGADGGWGDNTAKALEAFQKKHAQQGVPVRRYVEAGDYCLLLMAWDAEILIPMPGKTGMAGVKEMHEWFSKRSTPYNAGAEKGAGDRAIYGVSGRSDYAVQTTSMQYLAGPVEMDCTIYVNLMLSIYSSGCAHAAPYDASCASFGAVSTLHCARDRYSYPLVRRQVGEGKDAKSVGAFSDADQIRSAASARGSLYVLEVGEGKSGAVKHMTLLYDDTVYECTTGQSGSSCISRSLDQFMENKKGKIIYLFGPR